MQAEEYLQRTINRILVVLDEDAENRNELMRYAIGLSRLCKASLMLVCPVEPPVNLAYGFPDQGHPVMMFSEVWESEWAFAQRIVDEALAQCRGLGVEVERTGVTGSAELVSPKTTWASRSDLVVVSRPKKRGLEKLFGRDKAVDVVKSSPCPVVVIESAPIQPGPRLPPDSQIEKRGD